MQAAKIGERIRQLRAALGLTQQEFADKTGLSRGYIAEVETTKKEPSFNFVMSLLAATHVDSNWLLTGIGPMFLSDGGASPVVTLRCLDEPEVPLSPEARRALEEDQMVRNTVEMLSEMAPEQRRDICRYAEKEKLLTELLRERGGQAG